MNIQRRSPCPYDLGTLPAWTVRRYIVPIADESPRPHSARAASVIVAVNRGLLKRRSPRLALNTRVGLSGQDCHKQGFSIRVKATNLNRHGAAIQLNRELSVGSTLEVRNNRGTKLSARIVSQVSQVDAVRTYGIEFVEADERLNGFWGISLPSQPQS